MPQALTAEYFTSRGVDAASASRFANEHNQAAGIRTEPVAAPVPSQPPPQAPTRLSAPVPSPSPQVAPTDAQRAQAEIDDILGRRMRGEIDDYSWRTVWEPKRLQLAGIASSIAGYEAASPGDKNAQRLAWDADGVEQAFHASIDALPAPRSASEYQLPFSPNPTAEEAQVEEQFRSAMHTAAIPAAIGNHLGESVNDTAHELFIALESGGDEAADKIVERDTRALQERWGSAFERNVQTVRAYLLEQGQRNPDLRGLLTEHPMLFGSVASMGYLLQLAQSQQRRRARA
jgi:hypothetical protein